jgi:hypothetical protein
MEKENLKKQKFSNKLCPDINSNSGFRLLLLESRVSKLGFLPELSWRLSFYARS